MRASLRPSDLIGELPDERPSYFQSVQPGRSQMRVFADAVIRKPRPMAPGVRKGAVARQIEIDLDVVDAVFHRALAGVNRIAALARLQFNRQSFVSPENAFVARLRPRQFGTKTAAHFPAREQFLARVAVGVASI